MDKAQTATKERQYIRHPSRMPIRFDIQTASCDRGEVLRNVSEGGLCFSTCTAVESGQGIRVTIPVLGRHFEVDGVVAWCRGVAQGYEVGVRFLSPQDRFCVRMVEQLCYIEDYRGTVERNEGRTLTSEQAAREWIHRFAEEFPDVT